MVNQSEGAWIESVRIGKPVGQVASAPSQRTTRTQLHAETHAAAADGANALSAGRYPAQPWRNTRKPVPPMKKSILVPTS